MKKGWWLLVICLSLLGCVGEGESTATMNTSDKKVPADATETISPTSMPATATSAPNVANADVVFVKATETSPNVWQFDVTVSHPDTGWEDYADGWDILLPAGSIIKRSDSDPFTRLLTHPHEAEQPFTRSQSGLQLPPEVTEVQVRAHDLVEGWGGKEIVVDLTVSSGEGFEVVRLE